MSALSVQVPFPVFQNSQGQPLEDGYVWIGQANLDPQVNPINVYWDAALTISAAQPIRTLGGYPSNSGTPARLYVNSDYSIRVMNKNGSVIYSAPVATDRVSADLVSYQPAGTGAVATTVQAKLRETVSVKDFGAVGDGVTDDTAAIHAFFDALADSGGIGYINAGTYLCDPYVRDFNTQPSLGFTVYGSGPTTTTLKLKTHANFLEWYNANDIHINGITVDCGYSTLPATGVLSHGIAFYNCNDCSVDNCHAIDFSKTGFIGYTDSTTSGNRYYRIFFRNCYANAAAAKAASLDTNGVLISDYWYSGIENCIAENIYTYGIELKQDARYCHVIGCTAKNVADAGFAMGQTTAAIDGCDFNTVTDFISIGCSVGGVIGEGKNNFIDGFLVDFTGLSAAQQNSAFRFENASLNTLLGLSVFGAGANGVFFYDDASSTKGNYVEISNLAQCLPTYYAASFQAGSSNNSVIVKLITDQSNNIIEGSGVRYVSGGTNNKFFYQQYPNYRLGASGATNNTNAKMVLESSSNTIFNFLAPLASASGITFSNPSSSTDAIFHYDNTNKRFDLSVNAGAGGYRFQTAQFVPSTDNTISLGSVSARWSVVYAATGTINTSDIRDKQDIEYLEDAEKRVATALKGMVKKFRFKDSVTQKGDFARLHVGVMAQEVVKAFKDEGLDPMRYALVCYDEWPEQPEELDSDGNVVQQYRAAGNRYGIRYEQLLAFIIAAL